MKRGKFILYTSALLLPIRVLPTIRKVSLLDEWNNLTKHQKATRDFAWDYGQRYGFEKTLTAIAWQESSFGLPAKLENPTEPSGGIFGNGYTTTARRHFNLPVTSRKWVDKLGISHVQMDYALPTKKQKAYVRDKLKAEPSFSAHHAILQLLEGAQQSISMNIKKHGIGARSWQYNWAFYNGGTNCMKEPLALRYAEDILAKVKVINHVGYTGG